MYIKYTNTFLKGNKKHMATYYDKDITSLVPSSRSSIVAYHFSVTFESHHGEHRKIQLKEYLPVYMVGMANCCVVTLACHK